MMNAMELNNKELDMVNGGGFMLPPMQNRKVRCKHCGNYYIYPRENHKCPVFPKMDADNRPPIDKTLLVPKLPQE